MNLHPRTAAVRAALRPGEPSRPVSPPIHLSTTFHRETDGSYAGDYVYSRADNPNRRDLERTLAELEGGGTAFAFASGMAAIHAVFQSLDAGSHVLLPDDVYFNVHRLLDTVFARWGLTYTRANMADADAVRAGLRKETALVWIESPSNPRLKVTDVAAVTALAHDHGALVAADNTWLTPVIYRPFVEGVDVVVHSTTKYFGGHSDVLGGATIAHPAAPEWLTKRLGEVQRFGGSVPSPFDCWLARRGTTTLHLRAVAQSQTALSLAKFLNEHPKIERVNYPGLEGHPGHALARRNWRNGYGGMLSLEVRGGVEAARKVANGLRLFTQATSLGGVESLVEHRRSVEGPDSPTPNNLLRLSIGLEDGEDLIRDFERVLESV